MSDSKNSPAVRADERQRVLDQMNEKLAAQSAAHRPQIERLEQQNAALKHAIDDLVAAHRAEVERLQKDWRALPSGEWFYVHAEECLHPHTVAERTGGGWTAVCAMTYNNDAAKRDAQFIAEAPARIKQLEAEVERLTKALEAIKAEAVRYLTHLNSEKPLNAEYQAVKGRIITLACQLVSADKNRE